MGYRRIRDELKKRHDIDVNDKRILRLCRKEPHSVYYQSGSQRVVQRAANDPAHIARNYLNRDFPCGFAK
jgi:putative transposase